MQAELPAAGTTVHAFLSPASDDAMVGHLEIELDGDGRRRLFVGGVQCHVGMHLPGSRSSASYTPSMQVGELVRSHDRKLTAIVAALFHLPGFSTPEASPSRWLAETVAAAKSLGIATVDHLKRWSAESLQKAGVPASVVVHLAPFCQGRWNRLRADPRGARLVCARWPSGRSVPHHLSLAALAGCHFRQAPRQTWFSGPAEQLRPLASASVPLLPLRTDEGLEYEILASGAKKFVRRWT